MIDDKFIDNLLRIPLGDLLAKMVNVPCYKVPGVWNHNAHLYICWRITDFESTRMTIDSMMERYIEPALRSLAERVNEHDVVLCAPLSCLHDAVTMRQVCFKDQTLPLRLTVAYEGVPIHGEQGHRFTFDILTDLLDKPEIK